MGKAKELGQKGTKLIKERCNDKVSRIANIISLGALAVWSVLRFLWCFGVGGGGFNLWFFISSLYLLSFVAVHILVEMNKDHKYSILARTYFNFLNTIIGRGFFLIFMSMILIEKQDQGEIIIAIGVIATGICDIVLGWDQEDQGIPSEPWNQNANPRP